MMKPRLILILFTVFTLSARAQQNTREKKPNIIFILADDMGYGDAGFNGQEHIQTPHLDRLASEGMVFMDLLTTDQLTIITLIRYGIMTRR